MKKEEVADRIKKMLVENLRLPEEDLEYDTDLFAGDEGLDSIDALEIIAGIDDLFGVNMSGADREYFRSIHTLTEYVCACTKEA